MGQKIAPPKTEPETTKAPKRPAKTRDVRAKAAGTNRTYINMADKLEEEPEPLPSDRDHGDGQDQQGWHLHRLHPQQGHPSLPCGCCGTTATVPTGLTN